MSILYITLLLWTVAKLLAVAMSPTTATVRKQGSAKMEYSYKKTKTKQNKQFLEPESDDS